MATVLEYALMAGTAYRSTRDPRNRFPIPTSFGWSEIPAAYRNLLESGFEATAFQKGTEIVISFSGTDPANSGIFTTPDGITNKALSDGRWAEQLLQAAEYYLQIKASAPAGTTITFTGHSLGGGLAALMAVFFGEHAQTFDQAPFVRSALDWPHGDNATELRQRLAAMTVVVDGQTQRLYNDVALANLTQYLASRPVGGNVIPREMELVKSLRVQGEFLDAGPLSGRTIGEAMPSLTHGPMPWNNNYLAITGPAFDLHSQALLTAFLQSQESAPNQSFNEVTKKLVGVLPVLFQDALYQFPAGTANQRDDNFLDRLVRHEAGMGTALPADAMVTRFTADLWKLAKEGGLTVNDNDSYDATLNKVSKTLIAFAMQMYYEDTANATNLNKRLFADVTGGIQFDMADVSKTFATAFSGNGKLNLADAKGFDLYFKNYLAQSTFSGAERQLIQSLLPYMRDWYVQAGAAGLATTDILNRGAFMLGGTGSDALVGGTKIDLLVGNAGDDVLMGGQGNDLLLGGTGNDTYVFQSGDGLDTILDSDGQGSLLYDGVTLTGGAQYGDARVHRDTDGHLYVDVGNNRLIVDGSIVIEGQQAGQLGLTGMTGAVADVNPNTSLTITGDIRPDDIDPTKGGIQAFGDAQGNPLGTAQAYEDIRRGSDNNEHILTGELNDDISGEGGDDWLEGGNGNDFMHGGTGNDLIEGGAGSDILSGEGDNDRIYGNTRIATAAAIASGNAGSGSGQKGDWLSGNAGDDILVAGADNDVLAGGAGNDLLIAGAGNDYILGDAEYIPPYQWENIERYSIGDINWFHSRSDAFDWTVTPGAEVTVFAPITGEFDPAGSGADVIYAGSGNDTAWAGAGNDVVFGEEGDDRLQGNKGNDILLGGAGKDILWGGTESDYLDGGDQADDLYGEEGGDLLIGGKGDDTLHGGTGQDTYLFNAGDGSDTIDDTKAENNIIRFGAGVNKDHITLRLGSLLLDLGNGDAVHIGNFDQNDVFNSSAISGFEFADGSTLTTTELLARGFDLEGTAEGETILGTNTTDRINGKGGADYLAGGAGDDTYIFQAGDGAPTVDGLVEVVVDESGNDTVRFDGVDAGSFKVSTFSGDTQLLIEYGTGDQLNIANGINGAIESFEIGGERLSTSELIGRYSETSARTVNANGYQTLQGGRQNDLLNALAGHSIFSGGRGNDILIGSGGNNTYLYSLGDGTDSLTDGSAKLDAEGVPQPNTLKFGAGIAATDIKLGISSSGALMLQVGQNANDVIHIEGFNPNDTSGAIDRFEFADGSALTYAQLIAYGSDSTGTAGDDVLTSTALLDRMAGGAGNDTYRLSDAADLISEAAQAGQDTVEASIDYQLGDNLENLVLTGNARSGTGNALDNRITGNAGNNTLAGGSGDDFLDGGYGNDTLTGGDGKDNYRLSRLSGDDVLIDSGINRITLDGGIAFADVEATRQGNDLMLSIRGDIGSTRVQDYFTEGAAWEVVDAQGAQTDTSTLLATPPPLDGSALETLKRDFIARNRLGIEQGLQSAGYAPQADGRWFRSTVLEDSIVAARTDQRTTTTTQFVGQDGTVEASYTSSYDYTSWSSVNPFVYRRDETASIVQNRLSVGDTLVNLTTLDDQYSSYQMFWGDVRWGAGQFGSDLHFSTPTEVSPWPVNGQSGFVITQSSYDFLNTNYQGYLTGSFGLPSYTGELRATTPIWIISNSQNYHLDEIDLTPGNHQVYGDQYSMVIGNTGEDEISGVGFAYGGDGDDLIIDTDFAYGGRGDDTYYVSNQSDVVGENADEGHDRVMAYHDAILSDNVEDLIMVSGTSGTGNLLGNAVTGNNANNTLAGLAGNDVIDGLAGDDQLFGGDGDDTLYGGSDATYWVSDPSPMFVAVSYSVDNDAGSDAITGPGTRSAMVVISPGGGHSELVSNADFIDGGAGNDVINGGSGDDLLLGGEGDDVIYGGNSGTVWSGDIFLLVSGGNDILDGGTGNDQIDGGEGLDTLIGGVGDDTYAFALGDGADTIEEDDATVGKLDTISFGTDITAVAVTAHRVGQDFVLSYSATDSVTIKNWYDSNAHKIEQVRFADGSSWSSLQIEARANHAPVVANAPTTQLLTETWAFSYVLPVNMFADEDVGDHLTLSVTQVDRPELPSWLTFNAATRTLSGTPLDTATGLIGIAIKATDEAGAAVTTTLSLDIANIIDGTVSADTLIGTSWRDVIDGKAGSDNMTGGAGDDTFLINGTDGSSDKFQGDAGYDVVLGGVGDDTIRVHTYSGAATVEKIDGGLGANVIAGSSSDWDMIDLSGTELVNIAYIDAGAGMDTIIGSAGNDVILGGTGGDYLSGGAGDDTFLINGTDGSSDQFQGDAGYDVVLGGVGDDTIRVHTYSGAATVEKIDGGLGVNVIAGSSSDWDMIDLSGTELINIAYIDAGAGMDTIIGSAGNDVILGGTGGDYLYGGAGDDTFLINGTDGSSDKFQGDAGYDVVLGGVGDDTIRVHTYSGAATVEKIDGGLGANVIAGSSSDWDMIDLSGTELVNIAYIDAGAGMDTIIGSAGNDVILGGDGGDWLATSAGDDWVAAGKGNDTLDGGFGSNIFAFNRGDGADTINNGTWGNDIVSLGGGIAYASLKLIKTGSDLVLDAGAGDRLSLKNWYANAQNHGIGRLQVVTVGGDYDAASSDITRNKQVELFNFAKLVQNFDAAVAANSTVATTGWNVMNNLLDAHLSASDTQALGGDLSFQYATSGNLVGVGLVATPTELQTLKSHA